MAPLMLKRNFKLPLILRDRKSFVVVTLDDHQLNQHNKKILRPA